MNYFKKCCKLRLQTLIIVKIINFFLNLHILYFFLINTFSFLFFSNKIYVEITFDTAAMFLHNKYKLNILFKSSYNKN